MALNAAGGSRNFNVKDCEHPDNAATSCCYRNDNYREEDHQLLRLPNHGVEDLTELDCLDEESILSNFRTRFLVSSCGKGNRPYTGAGSNVLVALNPCRSLEGVYDRNTQLNYLRYNRTDLPAHVYAVSASVFWALHEGDGGAKPNNQTILLSGESGSGKSFNASILLEHLTLPAAVTPFGVRGDTHRRTDGCEQGHSGKDGGRLLQELVACQRTILESFGSARTTLNESSTRFTAHTKVLFSPLSHGSSSSSNFSFRVVGTELATFLLETSRFLPRRRRNGSAFHVFYQILHANEDVKKRLLLTGKHEEDFWITAAHSAPQDNEGAGAAPPVDSSSSGTKIVAAWASNGSRCTDDKASSFPKNFGEWNSSPHPGGLENILDALTAVGVGGDEQDGLLRGLSAVLHLGQIEFEEVAREEIHRGFTGVELVSEVPLEAASEMLGCHKHHLRNVLLTRRLSAGSGEVTKRRGQGRSEMLTVPLDRDQAGMARNSLIKEVYLRLLRRLVKRTNTATKCLGRGVKGEQKDTSFIGLLETGGFEHMKVNDFEQLCKNYAVEKIRGQFIRDKLTRGLDKNVSGSVESGNGEDPAWVHDVVFQVEGSSRLLRMFEDPLGLISLADDACRCPERSEGAFVNKLLETWKMTSEKPPSETSRGSIQAITKGDIGDSSKLVNSSWVVRADAFSTEENCSFIVKHYVGEVHYKADGILEMNRGGMGQSLLDLLDDGCKNEVVGARSRSSRYRRKMDESVLSQHRRQLTALLNKISHTQVRHVVCLKPNDQLLPTFINRDILFRQLSNAGISAAVRAGRLSIPSGQRVDKETFFKDYRQMPDVLKKVLENDLNCCKLGHGIIFFREGVWEAFEIRRAALANCSCEIIQRAWRAYALRAQTALGWERYLQEWETYHAAQRAAEDAAEAKAHWQQQWQHVQQLQRWQERYNSREMWDSGVFDSSHANAVREAARAQEVMNCEAEWQRSRQAAEAGASLMVSQKAAEAAASTAEAEAAARLLPQPVLEAWPVNENDEEHMDAPKSTTPPPSPPHFSWSGEVTILKDRWKRQRQKQKLVIPRLAWLADDAMRVFLTEPMATQYGMVRCRVTRRRDFGWKKLAPTYYMHHVEGGSAFMMSAKRKPLSLTTNFYISSSPAVETQKDTRFYTGKVRAHDSRGSAYTVYDNGVGPGRYSQDRRPGVLMRRELAGVVFSKTREKSDGPRAIKAAIPVVEGRWSTAAGSGTIADCLRQGRRHPGLVCMCDRKPRYDVAAEAYVLDFQGHVSMRSVKNFQLKPADTVSEKQRCRTWEEGENMKKRGGVMGRGGQVEEEDDVLLSFGKFSTDEFALDFRWPLSPVQAFGVALAAFDTSI